MNQTIRKQEKPSHYSYLKSFRVDQCKDFLNHQCTHHRPYTCFNWHFPNQRRRRCNIKDGIFNYSANEYCTKYSESNGICPDGDSCPYLHKNIGDTERRFHLRNFKTELCSGETDPQGVCSRNGHHCPYAHGSDDLRNPIQDNSDSSGKTTPDPTAEIRQSMASIDPCWADINYMMENYKVEKCENVNQKHQQLLCPYYHSIKERRRNFKLFKYRAVACPMVKLKEEWGDSSFCDQGDNCSYSHTRTELQYHPDVFRTVPCQNEIKNGFCPKGIFCAFSHNNNNLYIPITNNHNHKEDEIKIDNNSKSNQPSISNNHKNNHIQPPQQQQTENFSLFSSLFSPSNADSTKSTNSINHDKSNNHELKEIDSNEHILDQLDKIDTISLNIKPTSIMQNGKNTHALEEELQNLNLKLNQSEKEKLQLRTLYEDLFHWCKKCKEDNNKFQMQLEYVRNCNTAPFIDDGQVLHTLHPSFSLENCSLTNLLRVEHQLQKDLTQVYDVLTRITGEKCLLCHKEDACMVLPCHHKTLCHVCFSNATICPLCAAPFSPMQNSIPYHLHL